jgi:hypothetical protein
MPAHEPMRLWQDMDRTAPVSLPICVCGKTWKEAGNPSCADRRRAITGPISDCRVFSRVRAMCLCLPCKNRRYERMLAWPELAPSRNRIRP